MIKPKPAQIAAAERIVTNSIRPLETLPARSLASGVRAQRVLLAATTFGYRPPARITYDPEFEEFFDTYEQGEN